MKGEAGKVDKPGSFKYFIMTGLLFGLLVGAFYYVSFVAEVVVRFLYLKEIIIY